VNQMSSMSELRDASAIRCSTSFAGLPSGRGHRRRR
jgi:hypothetical protein